MDLTKLKVPELRALLKERGLNQKGVKAELLTRLQTVLNSETQIINTSKNNSSGL